MEYTTPSGAKLLVTLSSFQVGKELTLAIAKAIRQGGISSKLPSDFSLSSFSNLLKADLKELGGFMDMMIDVISHPEVETAIFKCLAQCTYNNERIDGPDFFNDVKRRGDFAFVAFQAGRENIAPFFSLLSLALPVTSRQSESAQG